MVVLILGRQKTDKTGDGKPSVTRMPLKLQKYVQLKLLYSETKFCYNNLHTSNVFKMRGSRNFT
jgi:hypothetical protein